MSLPVSIFLRPLTELKEDEWTIAEITINNYGDSTIQCLKVEIFGDIEAEKPLQIDALATDELLSYQIKIRPLNSEGIVVLKASEIQDGNVVDFAATTMRFPISGTKTVGVKGYKRFAAHEELICKVCQEKIYPGFLVVQCRCNATFHHKCVRDMLKCPVCGRTWK